MQRLREEGAGLYDFDVALVPALGVILLDALAHGGAGMGKGCGDS